MDEIWDSEILARKMLEIMPRLSRFMTHHISTLSENEATMMQIGALHMLMEKRLTTSDLAKKRRVSLQSASTFVQGLVDRNWVERVQDPNDRRQSILVVTEEGRNQANAMRSQMTETLAMLLRNLDIEEVSAAQVFLGGINRLMQENYIEESNNANDK